VAEDGLTHHQWVRARIAALAENRRAAVALAVASRHLAKLTNYLAAVGQDQTEAGRLLEKAWATLDGQEWLTPDELLEFCSNCAPPAPRDVPDDERPGAMMVCEAFCALLSAIHCAMHGRAQEAMNVLENGRVAAQLADGTEGAVRELAIQRRQLDAAASIPDIQELVTVLRREDFAARTSPRGPMKITGMDDLRSATPCVILVHSLPPAVGAAGSDRSRPGTLVDGRES
jgi:hypothetical protein